MKLLTVLSISILCFCGRYVLAQRPALDMQAYKEWVSVDAPKISNDGNYIVYSINNKPVGSKTHILQAVDFNWKREVVGDNNVLLTANNKYALYIKGKDSLSIIKLGTDSIEYYPNVGSLEIKGNKKKEWICYRLNDQNKTLVLKDPEKGLTFKYENVSSNWLDEDGKTLILKTLIDSNTYSLNYINLDNGRKVKIWSGNNIENLVLDTKHNQLAFKVNQKIWYYKFGSALSKCIVDGFSDTIFKKMKLDNVGSFNTDGSCLYFNVTEKEQPKSKTEAVEVWSYRDIKLHSEEVFEHNYNVYLTTINLNSKNIVYLGKKDDSRIITTKITGSYTLVESRKNGVASWVEDGKRRWSLLSIKDGKRLDLDFLDDRICNSVQLSPDQKFVIYFSTEQNSYFSYEVNTKIIRNIAQGLRTSWIQLKWSDDGGARPRGVVGWLKCDNSLLVYDQNDIWKLDPLSRKKPVNITNGYGKANNIVFNLCFDVMGEIFKKEKKYILTAFNIENKSNGFYLTQMEKAKNPECLSMGPYLFCSNSGYVPQGADFYPIKATDIKRYIVRRMSATESPNFYITDNFRTFKKVSNVHPEKKYNWYTTELHTWMSFDGKKLQGILYKPLNFDSTKKYPVIFYYYERLSDGLNACLRPGFSSGAIDIPTFVSNGYLIFCPDIYYKIGSPMQGTYNAVTSAAKYISSFPYVNSKKLGIQGFSFGAVQTNYLITHTDLFAAACSASGISDWISLYGGIFGGVGRPQVFSMQDYVEAKNWQGRMGGTLWERPEAYINNSPIFQVNKVTTPLLMMHTKNDDKYLYANALEFFTGLRRLGKKVWMLVYTEGNHELEGQESIDFTARMTQFFDYYLKDKNVPKWMLGDHEVGLELDSSGRFPGHGLLMPEEQKKVDSLLNRKPINIILK